MAGEITGTVFADDPLLGDLFGDSFNNTIGARNDSLYNASSNPLAGATGINPDGSPNIYGNEVDTAVSLVDREKLEEWLADEQAKDAANTTLSPEQRLQRHIANLAQAGQAVGMSANDIAGALNSVMADAGVTDSNFSPAALLAWLTHLPMLMASSTTLSTFHPKTQQRRHQQQIHQLLTPTKHQLRARLIPLVVLLHQTLLLPQQAQQT